MRTNRLWNAAFCMGLALVLSGLSLRGQAPPTRNRPQNSPHAPLVISEVLFDPRPGDVAFVELLNTGTEPLSLARIALRVDKLLIPLVRVPTPLAAAGRLIIRFDGQGNFDGKVFHASKSINIQPAGGMLDLRDEHDRQLDVVSWGDADGAVDVGNVDLINASPAVGRTIGRPPGSTRRADRSAWHTYGPDEATPGGENPLPRVGELIPSDGFTAEPVVALEWYPAVGATSYRVQLSAASDAAFAKPLMDRTMADSTADSPSLTPGEYIWRVQSIGVTGPGRFSAPARFEVTRRSTAGPMLPVGIALRVQQTQQPPVASSGHVLPVPLIRSHKDTKMLQLENQKEKDPHGWDVDHGDYRPSDPSDKYNCVPASIAMISKALGGNLSQDRIAYEGMSRNAANYAAGIIGAANMSGLAGRRTAADVHAWLKESVPGPEWDLVYGSGANPGFNPAQTLAALTFAFGGTPRLYILETADDIWNAVRHEIDGGRPMLMSHPLPNSNTAHVQVLKGYEIIRGHRVLVFNNPARTGEWRRSLESANLQPNRLVFYFLPSSPIVRRQSPDVTMDRDGDGVVDFDETERFKTDPLMIDTDLDGVMDKADIASGVFDSVWGYAFHPTPGSPGRDYDRDNNPTELDEDSDDGGCNDGVEDDDRDGHLNGTETWNFLHEDDLCKNVNGHITTVSEASGSRLLGLFAHSYMSVSVSLKPERPGELGTLEDNGSTFRASTTGQLSIRLDGGCTIYSWGSASGSGRFPPGPSSIGGSVDVDSLVVGGQVDIPGTYFSDLCIFSGGDANESSASIGDCQGKRVSRQSRSFTFSCHETKPPDPSGLLDSVVVTTSGSVTLDTGFDPGFMTLLPDKPDLHQRRYEEEPTLSIRGGRIVRGSRRF